MLLYYMVSKKVIPVPIKYVEMGRWVRNLFDHKMNVGLHKRIFDSA